MLDKTANRAERFVAVRASAYADIETLMDTCRETTPGEKWTKAIWNRSLTFPCIINFVMDERINYEK